MAGNLRIGDVLTEMGYVTASQMAKALDYQKEHRDKRVGQILMELGFVEETQVLEALANRLGLEIVDVAQLQIEIGGEKSVSAGEHTKRDDAPCDQRSAELLCTGRGAAADRMLSSDPAQRGGRAQTGDLLLLHGGQCTDGGDTGECRLCGGRAREHEFRRAGRGGGR